MIPVERRFLPRVWTMGRWEGSGAGEEQPVLGLGGAAASGEPGGRWDPGRNSRFGRVVEPPHSLQKLLREV